MSNRLIRPSLSFEWRANHRFVGFWVRYGRQSDRECAHISLSLGCGSPEWFSRDDSEWACRVLFSNSQWACRGLVKSNVSQSFECISCAKSLNFPLDICVGQRAGMACVNDWQTQLTFHTTEINRFIVFHFSSVSWNFSQIDLFLRFSDVTFLSAVPCPNELHILIFTSKPIHPTRCDCVRWYFDKVPNSFQTK